MSILQLRYPSSEGPHGTPLLLDAPSGDLRVANLAAYSLAVTPGELRPQIVYVCNSIRDEFTFEPDTVRLLFVRSEHEIGSPEPIDWSEPLAAPAPGGLTYSQDDVPHGTPPARVLDSAGAPVRRIETLSVFQDMDMDRPITTVVLACPPDDVLSGEPPAHWLSGPSLHTRSAHYIANPHPAFPHSAKEAPRA